MIDNSIRWTTKNEIEFITKLGTWRPETRSNLIKLHEGYLKGLKQRVNFGNLDKKKILKHAQDMLDSLKG